VLEVDEIINSLASVAESVQIRFLWRPLLSEPADDMVLETAVDGRADLLVTFNREDFAAAAKERGRRSSPFWPRSRETGFFPGPIHTPPRQNYRTEELLTSRSLTIGNQFSACSAL
jgi:hypothetical protein